MKINGLFACERWSIISRLLKALIIFLDICTNIHLFFRLLINKLIEF